MSKRRHRSDRDGEREHEGESRRRRQRHLYLVLDDWSKGYNIYKVDVDGFDGDPDADMDSRAGSLPDPPVFRLETADYGRSARFAAVGSRIFATYYSEESDAGAPTLVYDTATGGLAVGPRVPPGLQNLPSLVPAGDRLYAMDTSRRDVGRDYFEELAAADGQRSRWACRGVRLPPFDVGLVACHAAHPDGRTVFFSAHGKGTYSFDAVRHEWERHGDWMLPFRGEAYYDGELDAWVGLWSGPGDRGRVCSCHVVPAARGECGPPAWKLAGEGITGCDDWVRQNSAALVHMGGGEFCLVEWRSRKAVPEDALEERCLLYATAFRLRYDRDGALRATARRTRSYEALKKSKEFRWCAFGI